MAKPREHVSRTMKRRLIREAGEKCANPGCSNYRVHLHHIEHWVVYQTNDEKTMIAICPTCHDAVHHGTLPIDDDTLFRWKAIRRTPTQRDHLYIEPGSSWKLLLGTIAVSSVSGGLIVFALSDRNRLSFRLVDGDIMMLNLAIATVSDREVIRVVDNHVKRQADDLIQYDRRPGRIRVTSAVTPEILPSWALKKIRLQEPTYAADDRLVALDLEVLKPGLVRVQGIWADPTEVYVVTPERFAHVDPYLREPVSLVGAGEETVLMYAGKIDKALFAGRRNAASAALHF